MAMVQLDANLRVALELEPEAAARALEQLQQQAGAADASRSLALVLAVPSVEQLLDHEARTEACPEERPLLNLFTPLPQVYNAVSRLLTSFRQSQHSPVQ